MRTFLAVIGGLFLLVILSIGILFAIGMQKVGSLTKEAEAYADESIMAIATGWDGAAMASRASPELKSLLGDGALENLMAQGATQLGAMTEARPAKCQIVKYEATTESGELAGAECYADATFDRGPAKIKLTEVKRNGSWALLGLWFSAAGGEMKPEPVQVAYAPAGALGLGATTAPATGLTLSTRGVAISFAPEPDQSTAHVRSER